MKNKIVAFGMAILLSSQFMMPINATTSNPSEVVYECDGISTFLQKCFNNNYSLKIFDKEERDRTDQYIDKFKDEFKNNNPEVIIDLIISNDLYLYFDETSGIVPYAIETVHANRQYYDIVHDEYGRYYKDVNTYMYGTYTRNVGTGIISSASCTADVSFTGWGTAFYPQYTNMSTYGTISGNKMNVTFYCHYNVISYVSEMRSMSFGSISHQYTVS